MDEKNDGAAYKGTSSTEGSVSSVKMTFRTEDLELLWIECRVNADCCIDEEEQKNYERLAKRFSLALSKQSVRNDSR